MYTYIYIYIYIEREREIYIYIYTYIHKYMYMHIVPPARLRAGTHGCWWRDAAGPRVAGGGTCAEKLREFHDPGF